ncbi:MAG TPA: NADH:flavin oxidoreductase/NADH oxidase [Actinocrinis sp.]|nr:NADH:flavin oxidoreductase/NADH oxidase [Actinocrinis sp.]
MSSLFTPLTLRGVTFANRAWVSPMCQYSSVEGRPTDWHLVHLGALARGGAGLVFTEATAVTPEGRISPQDAGIWNDEQVADYARITKFIREQGAVPGIQLGHAGRKASTYSSWRGEGSVPQSDGGWTTVAPSAAAFGDYAAPVALTVEQIAGLVDDWAAAARRAVAAGFEVIELHAAHGYLLHQFLSPLSNQRTDEYGGGLEGRSRLLLEITDAVRAAIPDTTALFVRLSATDWVDGALTVQDTAEVAAVLATHGVDLIDVSSGGNSPDAKITTGPGYQVPFTRAIRERSGLPVAAVGMITEPQQAEKYLCDEDADAVLLARALLREPTWPQRAAFELGDDLPWPVQYERAKPRH